MTAQIKTYPIVANAINLFGDWLRRRQEIRELRELNGGDFARVARDVGVPCGELDNFVRLGQHASDELPKLLTAVGVDQSELARTEPALMRDMVRVCAACQHSTRCNRDLETGTIAQHYTEYCGNAPVISELSGGK